MINDNALIDDGAVVVCCLLRCRDQRMVDEERKLQKQTDISDETAYYSGYEVYLTVHSATLLRLFENLSYRYLALCM